MRRILATAAAAALAIVVAPAAMAQTMVQGGPLTNLNPAGDKIHLALSGYPTAHGLYIYQAVQPTAGARPTALNTATQIWVGTDKGATDPKSDIVLVVDNGHAWGADCAHQVCGIFVRLDHTAPTDTSEDQFIPITFAAATATTTTTTLPADTIAVKIDGVDAKENVPGKIAYRQVVTFAATSGSGTAVTLKSYTPDLCPVTGNTVTALKGSGQCDIAATSAGSATVGPKTSHFPLIVGLGVQTANVGHIGFKVKVGASWTLAKVTNFGETITYKALTKNCSISGATLKAVKVGACKISATAPATANYKAFSATDIFVVSKK